MKKSLLTLCVLSFILPLSAQVGVLKALKPGLFDIVSLHKYFENPDEGDYDFRKSFGLLCTSLKGKVIYKKPSFYAVRNMVNLLPDAVEPAEVSFTSSIKEPVKVTGLQKDGKLIGAMLYLSGNKPSSALEWQKARIAIEGLKLENPVLVEPVTGRIFSLDRYHYSPNNPTRTYSLQVWDSPVFLLEHNAVLSTSTNSEWHHEW